MPNEFAAGSRNWATNYFTLPAKICTKRYA